MQYPSPSIYKSKATTTVSIHLLAPPPHLPRLNFTTMKVEVDVLRGCEGSSSGGGGGGGGGGEGNGR